MKYISKNNTLKLIELQNEAQENGLFLYIDKGIDWTSHDVVAKVRYLTKIKKVGHSGTLDPFATGLLILAIGRKATKQLSEFLNTDKHYEAELKLGAFTKTDDVEGEEEDIKDISNITEEMIRDVFSRHIGVIKQIPPMYSAKKIKGQKLYEIARKNQEIEREASEVEIFKNEVISIDLPYVKFQVHCSKGTYIRAIARDIGKELGVGGYLTKLRRTSIADHKVDEALTIEEFEKSLL